MGFGLWIQQFSVQETLESGNVDLVFTSAFTDDDGAVDDVLLDSQDNASSTQVFDAWGPSSSADPAAAGPDPKLRYDKDVARCEALIDGSVTQDGAYPRYNCTSWFSMQNSGTVPLKVRRIRVDTASGSKNLDPTGGLVKIDLDDADLDADNSTGADAEAGASDLALCQQINPGETVRIGVRTHTLQAAPQDENLIYSVDVEAAQWNELATSTDPLASLYRDVFDVLGTNAVVMPLGDFPVTEPNACPGLDQTGFKFAGSTFETVGEQALLFSWNEPPTNFDAPGAYQDMIPVVSFNGIDEEADTPDATFWTTIASESFTVGAWVRPRAVSSAIIGKWDGNTGAQDQEWLFTTNSAGNIGLWIYDEVHNAKIGRKIETALELNEWVFLVARYTGGTTSAAINIFKNGAVADDANDQSGSGFESMVDGGTSLALGFYMGVAATSAPKNLFDGDMAGGPLGPFFVKSELSADDVLKLYNLGASALELGP